MGILDQMAKAYGPDWNQSTATEETRHNWQLICVCGHQARGHAPSIGGTYKVKPDGDYLNRGETRHRVSVFAGCLGALPPRGTEPSTMTVDEPKKLLTITYHPTCPCEEFRGVAKVDRPNRYFNQQVRDRHPMTVGLQAFSTHLSRRKAADPDRGGDPSWTAAELDRRFLWIPEAQRCSISGCKVTGDDVLPAYVNGDRHSEMRCSKHRD